VTAPVNGGEFLVRRSWLAGLLSAAVLIGLFPTSALAVPPPLPGSIAAVGDSITQAASSGGSLGADYPANSWSTGANASVNSQYQRLVALNPDISGNAHNFSVSGARMVHLDGQIQQAASVQPDYLTVLIGGNDVCTDTEAQMTSLPDFRAQFELAMATLTANSPGTNVYVVSIPRVKGLWELFKDDWWARFIWNVGGICQSMLANPTSTQQADVDRRARVDQRNRDYNTILAQVCAATPRCRSDGGAAYAAGFVAADAAGDYFHPSIQGQAKLAQVSWAAGYWPNGAPPAGTVHVADLAGSAAPRKGGWSATVAVHVVDNVGASVGGATVTGSWSTGAGGGCTTSGAGTCSFSLNLGKKVTAATWTVAAITHATLSYDPGANGENSVSVTRP
jgi:lysophospholipase L1-like esterase